MTISISSLHRRFSIGDFRQNLFVLIFYRSAMSRRLKIEVNVANEAEMLPFAVLHAENNGG